MFWPVNICAFDWFSPSTTRAYIRAHFVVQRIRAHFPVSLQHFPEQFPKLNFVFQLLSAATGNVNSKNDGNEILLTVNNVAASVKGYWCFIAAMLLLLMILATELRVPVALTAVTLYMWHTHIQIFKLVCVCDLAHLCFVTEMQQFSSFRHCYYKYCLYLSNLCIDNI